MPSTAAATTTLVSWRDSNMAGDRWTWRVFVTRRSDGSYSVGARQDIVGRFRVIRVIRSRDGVRVRKEPLGSA